MTKAFINSDLVEANGTSLKGFIMATYDQLVEIFGEPTYKGGDKTTAEWKLQFYDGTVATIYDWKMYDTPLGQYDWHIGGYDIQSVNLVHDAFNGLLTDEFLELMEEYNKG